MCSEAFQILYDSYQTAVYSHDRIGQYPLERAILRGIEKSFELSLSIIKFSKLFQMILKHLKISQIFLNYIFKSCLFFFL